ncbi:N-acetylmuramoyl-L-alanine amidase [Leeuwenhoekiella aestuarii]|uniref:N-acetylmuramoyl-L-alanine amidase n=1 Tax=Leeuwenhoekiella aestuarii TaxID=2249426 RepID=A0A4Q0NVQ6_9FLAO|nr:N-acetylmuramoyl-L-alanine amidase [Leeuwenhoekiella aestuarii]RXG11632.1 N-acetylmuramoyl-L-alanine amidase [Leeuwenhoekiella aestuarii]RXG15157.1 N-acetylmuramoyl-L-alanine amidase [Leeuwenhoekiella aestuarii]
MKLQNVVFLYLLLKTCLFFGQDVYRPLRIVIDPGHGGMDSGARGLNGILEKDLVLDLAQRLITGQQEFDGKPAEYFLTRYTDTLISLGDRTKLARILQADLFISLHYNDASNSNATGVEVYAYNQENPYLEQSIWLGHLLEKRLVVLTGQKSRGVKFANFQVLRDLKDFCPAIVLEVGFIKDIR